MSQIAPVVRYSQAFLNRPPTFIAIGDYPELTEQWRDWVQTHRWTIHLYLHSGVLLYNSIPIPFRAGDISIWPPGARGGHAEVGKGTPHQYATFDLPGEHTRMAIPVLATVPNIEESFHRACKAASQSLAKAIAFVWNLLWDLAEPASKFRNDEELYRAEAWIKSHLDEPFTVAQMAGDLELSQRTLLRLFQLQHGSSIKHFVTRTRVREATRLLTTTGMPIKVVASKVGISNLQQFNKTVRQFIGMSPTALRERTADDDPMGR